MSVEGAVHRGRRSPLPSAMSPGTLLAVLRGVRNHGLNMSKLESQPSRERAWEYVFWVDLDADGSDPETKAALAELVNVTTMLRVLGRLYPRGPGGGAGSGGKSAGRAAASASVSPTRRTTLARYQGQRQRRPRTRRKQRCAPRSDHGGWRFGT